MSQFASEKKYLELDGLKALILKIASMRDEYMSQNGGVVDALGALLARVDLIVAPGAPDEVGNASDNVLPATESYGYTEGTLFECVAKYIQVLRDELGATADKNDSTVYARLDQIEDWVNNGFDAEDGTHYDGLLARVAELERAAEDDFVASVEYSTEAEVKENNKWEAVFKSRSGKELAKIGLDTSEFVIDGMLGDVKMISVVDNGTAVRDLGTGTDYTITDAVGPWLTIINESATRENGERYLVFSFKTTEAGVPTPDFAGEATGLKNIWIYVKDIHDNFVFEAESGPAEYITLEVAEPLHTADGATRIVYTTKLTVDAVKALDWVLKGDAATKIDSYDVLNADVDKAQEDVADLQDKVINGFEETDGDNESVVPEGSTGGTHHQDGLLTRANRLEKRATDLEEDMAGVTDWIENHMIPVDFINDYFEYAVNDTPFEKVPDIKDYI